MNRFALKICLLVLLASPALCGPAPADAGILRLPEGLTAVAREAFCGDTALDEVILPDGIRTIGQRAFASSSVRWIHIPGSVTSIAQDAFRDAGGAYCGGGRYLVISAPEDSAAAEFAAAQPEDANIRCCTGAVTVSYSWKKKLAVGLEFDLDPVAFPSGEKIAFASGNSSASVDARGRVRILDEGTVTISFTDSAGKHTLITGEVLPVFYCPGEGAGGGSDELIYSDEDISPCWRCESLGPGGEDAAGRETAPALPAGSGGTLYINALNMGPWRASVTDGSGWIHLSRSVGNETEVDLASVFTADRNTSGAERTGHIRFTLGKYVYDHEVRQLPEAQVVHVRSVGLDTASKVMMPGDSVILTASVLPETATDRSVSWTSSNPAAAAVKHGIVTAVGTGTADITVKTTDGGRTATCAMTVVEKSPDDLPKDNTLCFVALGFKLNADGSMQRELIGRLEVLLRVVQDFPNAVIVCTGGPTANSNPSATEAGRMAAWLRARGVDSGRILVESRSMTTSQNALYTFELLKKNQPQVARMVLITSDYHMSSAMTQFRSQAAKAGGITVTAGQAWITPRAKRQ